MFSISEVDKSDSDLALLVSELDAFQSELYPAESNHSAWTFQQLVTSSSGASLYVMKGGLLQVVVLCYFRDMAKLRSSGFIFDRNTVAGSSESR